MIMKIGFVYCKSNLYRNSESKAQKYHKVAMHLKHVMKRMVDRYNDTHEDKLPSITPHALRHTFCTEMANSGIDLKSLQYLMGHSDVGVTLNIYTHASYERAGSAMRNAVWNVWGVHQIYTKSVNSGVDLRRMIKAANFYFR